MEKETKKHINRRPPDKAEGEKYGLVLGGGGSKGCYHVGVWQAFNEAGVRFDAITGTSIGALVGIFYPGNRIETVTDFVMNMQPTEIAQDLPALPVTLKEKVKGSKTVLNFIIRYFESRMDIRPLREHFRNMFDYEIFKDSPVRYACMAYNDTKKEPRAFFKGEITAENAEEIVMASSACYPAFPKVTIGDDVYMDGMYADNVPIDLLYSIQPETTWSVIVDLHDPGEPLPPSLGENMFYLEPLVNPGNALDFTTGHAMRLYNQGYLEARKHLGSLTGYLFSFELRDLPLMQIVEDYLIKQTTQMNIVFPKVEHLDLHVLKAALGYTPGYIYTAEDPGYEFGRYIEALALYARIDPVALYSYPDFLEMIVERLRDRHIESENDEYKIVELFSKMKRDEVMIMLHRMLVRHHGHLSERVESLKEQMPVSYTLAWIWYCLEALLDSLHDVRGDNETKSLDESSGREEKEDESADQTQPDATKPPVPENHPDVVLPDPDDPQFVPSMPVQPLKEGESQVGMMPEENADDRKSRADTQEASDRAIDQQKQEDDQCLKEEALQSDPAFASKKTPA